LFFLFERIISVRLFMTRSLVNDVPFFFFDVLRYKIIYSLKSSNKIIYSKLSLNPPLRCAI